MRFNKRHRNEDGAQDVEHIGLDEAHQHVQQEHEQGEGHREDARADTHAHSEQAGEDEDEQHQHQDHHVAAHHVGKETDHQRQGLGEQ